jgi:hypothetical protein
MIPILNPFTGKLQLINDELVVPPTLSHPEALVGFLKGLNKTAYYQGSCGILGFGDSITRGGISESVLSHGYLSLVRNELQKIYNPPGVPGGIGYVPVATFSGSAWNNPNTGIQPSAVFTITGTPAYYGRFTTAPGLIACRMNAASGNSAAYTFNGAASDALFTKSGITAVSALTYGPNSHTVVPFTVFNNTTTTMTASGNFNANSASGGKVTLLASGLNPLHSYTVTVSAPASGGNVWLSGLIGFNGDENCGVHLHNLANWGSRLVDDGTASQGLMDVISGSQVTNRATAIASNITTFTAQNSLATNGITLGQSSKAKLAIIGYSGTNDDGGSVTLANFTLAVDYLNTALISAGVTPLWVMLTAPFGRETTYYPYNDVILSKASPQVCVLDIASGLGRPSYGANSPGGFMYDRGWYGDATHLLSGWHKFYADQIVAAIVAAEQYARSKELI